MAGFPAFLDACVLVPIRLTDVLLRLADAGTYRPFWSADVLAEVERTLAKLGCDAAKSTRRIEAMRRSFPDAEVTNYQPLVSAMTNDPKDRHVLAAAVRANAEVLVTFNGKDFPSTSLDRYHLTVVHPDAFLLDQLDLDPDATVRCLEEQVAAYRNPAMTMPAFLEVFQATVPRFVACVSQML